MIQKLQNETNDLKVLLIELRAQKDEAHKEAAKYQAELTIANKKIATL